MHRKGDFGRARLPRNLQPEAVKSWLRPSAPQARPPCRTPSQPIPQAPSGATYSKDVAPDGALEGGVTWATKMSRLRRLRQTSDASGVPWHHAPPLVVGVSSRASPKKGSAGASPYQTSRGRATLQRSHPRTFIGTMHRPWRLVSPAEPRPFIYARLCRSHQSSLRD